MYGAAKVPPQRGARSRRVSYCLLTVLTISYMHLSRLTARAMGGLPVRESQTIDSLTVQQESAVMLRPITSPCYVFLSTYMHLYDEYYVQRVPRHLSR